MDCQGIEETSLEKDQTIKIYCVNIIVNTDPAMIAHDTVHHDDTYCTSSLNKYGSTGVTIMEEENNAFPGLPSERFSVFHRQDHSPELSPVHT